LDHTEEKSASNATGGRRERLLDLLIAGDLPLGDLPLGDLPLGDLPLGDLPPLLELDDCDLGLGLVFVIVSIF
jgi:hypothetical protein